MSATKLPTIIGLLGKLEASYNAGGSLSTSTDGIQLAGPATPTLDYAFDGERRPPPAITGYQRRLTPQGRACSVTLPHEAKGAAAAYNGTTNVFSARTLLRLCGFDVALDATGGAEKETYTPTPGMTGFGSGLFEAYARGQKYPIQAAYGDLSVTFDDNSAPLMEVAIRGLVGAITDTTVPAITYPTLTTDPAKAAGITLSLGNFVNAVVRRGKFTLGRQIGARRNQNSAAGHAGFSPGRRTPVLELTVEATAFTTTPFHAASAIDPYNLYDAATLLDCQLQFGSTQYNRWKIKPGKVQLMAPPTEDEDEGGALWSLRLQCNPTTLNGNDDVSLIAD